jgi:hypothetical protein
MTDPLQTALAAEHAAVYVFGVLGGRTSRHATPALYDAVAAAYAVHRDRRDQLTRSITEAGADPLAAEPAYDLPRTPERADPIKRAALRTERACATTYAWLTENSAGPDRRWAIDALRDSAVRELAFGGTPEAFPGGPFPDSPAS